VRSALLFTACLLFAGCARPIERGQALYQDGRYVEAAETFELTEPRLAGMPADACATFGLYRGLTYLRLDDVASARKWLAYTYSIEQKSPGMLPPEQRHLLDRGWAELERKASPPPARAADEQKVAAAAAAGVPAPQAAQQPHAAPPAPSTPAVQ
jgi:hypothetical protein